MAAGRPPPPAATIAEISAAYARPSSFLPSYGTAGFRSDAALLASTVFRCGLLTAARALALGRPCGLMITASHNPEADNGVKIVEPGGEMLVQAWEPEATDLARCDDHVEVAARVLRLAAGGGGPGGHGSVLGQQQQQQQQQREQPPAVLVGWDTRPSAGALVRAACDGVQAMGLQPVELGEVTTPQLHFQVAALNAGELHWTPEQQQQQQQQQQDERQGSEGHPPVAPPAGAVTSLDLYFRTLLSAFEELVAGAARASGPAAGVGEPGGPGSLGGPSADGGDTTRGHRSRPVSPLFVDCANGVGAQHLQRAAAHLAAGTSGLTLRLINMGGQGGRLNHHCGADFVQKESRAPAGCAELGPGDRSCSIDGDADRLVYFAPAQHQEQHQKGVEVGGQQQQHSSVQSRLDGGHPHVALLDGDRIAALLAVLVSDALRRLPGDLARSMQVGVVQTAYANGASSHFITQQLGLRVVCAKTGVKHLHPEAHAFDVGIYFEANGHGTALFSPRLLEHLAQVQHTCPAARQLLLLSRVINQTVGDALSGILAVEAALRLKGWGIGEWQAMYQDLPSRQSKLCVKDRTVITTADAERVAVAPAGLQPAIDTLVAQAGEQARAFVRPSGTEDIVRVYAEARTQAGADALAAAVARATHELAGGVGPLL